MNFQLAELLEEREWRKCSPDTTDPEELLAAFKHFCETYWYIRVPGKGRIKFEMFDAQVETVKFWLDNRFCLMLKARQLGFSTLVATFTFWQAFFYPDRVIIMLSRTERDAIKLLNKAKYGYRFLPEWMKFRGPPVNTIQTKMEFAHESYIESLPSASDPARGESVDLVVLDELAYLPNSEEAWAAIEPTTEIGGRVIALSTANGEGNLFHKLWVGATTGTSRFKAKFFPWSACGRDDEWYERQKADLPEWQLAQEYPDNPDDAFLKSGRPVFSLDVLRSIETRDPLTVGFFSEAHSWKYLPERGGPLRIWEMPVQDGRYAIGADPAQGFEHGDYSSAHVINVRNGNVVAHWHGRIDPDLFGTQVLSPLGRMYNSALLGVESNNHGLTTLKALQKSKYHPLYMQRSPRYKRSVPTDILGWRTTQITKPLAVDELNQALREHVVNLFDVETIAELRTFTRDDAGKMSGSPFDDRVMSLAIANQMTKHVWLKQYEPVSEPPPGTFGYLEKLLFGDDPLADSRGQRKIGRQPFGSQWTR